MKHVLVLGGTGAIGVYLVRELLKKGYAVDVTTRRGGRKGLRVSYLVGDAKDDHFIESVLSNAKYDAVVDFMLYTTEEFKSRVDLLLRSTSHYVFTSTYRVFADSAVITEESPRLLDVSSDKEYLETDEYALAKARQEDVLQANKKKNWTIVRPSITFSKDRFQLGVLEADTLVYRALSGKATVFPKEMENKFTTMTWAGDVAKMIAGIVLDDRTMAESYNVATAENHKWSEVISYYKKAIGLRVKRVSLDDFLKIYPKKYQVLYDRMFNRIMDNSKILDLTGMKQNQFTHLEDALTAELNAFRKNPQFNEVNGTLNRDIDTLVDGAVKKVAKKLKPRTRLAAARRAMRPRSRLLSAKQRLRIRTRIRNYKNTRNNTKKDGLIVTLTGNHNYGGIIQRYALKQYLHSNGGFTFDTVSTPTSERQVTGGNFASMDSFIAKHLSSKRFEPDNLQGYRNYIVGSDQVFRNWYENNWQEFSMFFLEFVKGDKANKTTYAASFGVDSLIAAGIDDSNREGVSRLLRDFDSISVREKSGINLITELVPDYPKGQIESVLDPTLLLTAKDYSELIDASPIATGKNARLFCYILDASPAKQKIIDEYAAQYDGNIKVISPQSERPYESVEEWLSGFRDAEFVLTDSFHGAVFSIINNTDFMVIGNELRGLARITDLFESLTIGKDRVITPGKSVRNNPRPLNWGAVNSRLRILQKSSGHWLISHLKR